MQEGVVAIPLARLVDRRGEDAATTNEVHECRSRQCLPAGILAGQGIAERNTEAVEDRSPQQRRAHRCRLRREDLVEKVLRNQRRATGEACRRIAARPAMTQQQRRQAHAGRPAAAALVQQRQGGVADFAGRSVLDDLRGLLAVELQLTRADLVQRPAHPQRTKGQWRIAARDEHQMQMGWRPQQQAVEQGVCFAVVNAMKIVEDQYQRLGEIVEFVVQQGSQNGKRRQVLGSETGKSPAAGLRQHAAHGSDEGMDEGVRLVITRVERQPGSEADAVCQPVRHQRGLAVAQRCGHHRQG